jgi:hypothetical protein
MSFCSLYHTQNVRSVSVHCTRGHDEESRNSRTRWRIHGTRGHDEDSRNLGTRWRLHGTRGHGEDCTDVLAVCRLDRCLVDRSRSYWRGWFLWKRSWVMRRVQCPSKSKSHCDWWSVSQYVLVSSPNLGLLTRFFFQSYYLVFLGRPLWREVGSVMCVSVFVIEVYHSLVYLQQYLHLN